MGLHEYERGPGRWRQGLKRAADWVGSRRFKVAGSGGPGIALASLTPAFDADQHQAYVDHLNDALRNKRVHNIALTGRYGAGKSSVLEEFARQQGMTERVLFLSLSTLGTPDKDETRTNQIEKELVKQVLHREKPSRLPQSRYQRIEGLTRSRARVEAAASLVGASVVLWVFGVFPGLPGLTGNDPWWMRLGAALLTSSAWIALVAWARLAMHNRFVISKLSAGGASVTLSDRSESYFDQYLDEIVYFFGSVPDVDVVVFEDLDRFDDPGIFEALRELNTLLNNSKQMGRKTIRFVYALRDSIFEKLGHDAPDDAAEAEVVRANRTKFFDLVIPIVPFITHRTSRDLLKKLLNDDELTPVVPVSLELVDLTARHLPDMRLLTNVRNEYSIFSKRLITDKRGVDSLDADRLFAMVVYKNVHLADFEMVLLGRSSLDEIYWFSRQLVSESIANRRQRIREVSDTAHVQKALEDRAVEWGQRLTWYVQKLGTTTRWGTATSFEINGIKFDLNQVNTDEFWRAQSSSGRTISVTHRTGGTHIVTIEDLQVLLGDTLPMGDWEETTQDAIGHEIQDLRADIEFLRTADFSDLAKRGDLVLTRHGHEMSFRSALEKHVDSEIGRALITEGFINRYYTLYVAQYYGERVPANAMNFIVQNVDNNKSDTNYRFNSVDEIAAVLRETNQSFLREASAQNLDILDYLLEHDGSGAGVVLDAVISSFGESEQAFLNTYLAEGDQSPVAIAYLAPRWPSVFVQLVSTIDLAADRRTELVDIALANSDGEFDYEFSPEVREFLQKNLASLPTLMKEPNAIGGGKDMPDARSGDAGQGVSIDDQVRNTVRTLERARIVCEDLSVLSSLAVSALVDRNLFMVTASNLRAALGDPLTLSLDRIRTINQSVYHRLLDETREYLTAIAEDYPEPERTAGDESIESVAVNNDRVEADHESPPRRETKTIWSIEDPMAFVEVVHDFWLYSHNMDLLVDVASSAHPECTVMDLERVHKRTWEILARCQRFPATLANIDSYVQHVGELDAHLAAILMASGTIDVSGSASGEVDSVDPGEESETKVRVAEVILKASERISDQGIRVRLVASLQLENYLPVACVPQEAGHLLGLLIAEDVCDDERALFDHMDTNDWDTMRFAIGKSRKFAKFVDGQLLDADTTALLLESDIASDLKRMVLGRFDEFVPANHRESLVAAGRASMATDTPLDAGPISMIARGTGDADLVVRMVDKFGSGLSADEVIAILVLLPAPYDKLADVGAKLTIERTEYHLAVIRRLGKAGRVSFRTRPKSVHKGARIDVTVNGRS